MPKHSEKIVLANMASARKTEIKKKDRLNNLGVEYKELEFIHEDVSIKFIEADLEAMELRAKIAAIEEHLSQTSPIVTEQEKKNELYFSFV
jgi:hypothetical protein